MVDITKCQINATQDMISAAGPKALANLMSKNIPLHFHKCKLNHHQVEALTSVDSVGTIILEQSSFSGLEGMFSKAKGKLRVAFKERCSKFMSLVDHVKAGKINALLFSDIDLVPLYEEQGDASLRVAGERGLAEFKLLVETARSKCKVIVCDMVMGNESCKKKLPAYIWRSDISIDDFVTLDTEEVGFETGSTTSPDSSIDGTSARIEEVHVKPDSTDNPDVKWTVVCRESKGNKTVEVSSDGSTLQFINFGSQKLPFKLQVGMKKVFPETGTTVIPLEDGNLKYFFKGAKICASLTAKVPATATEAKWWCTNCADPTRKCSNHKIG